MINCDYLIIGAGSAGCVLANRLSAAPDIRVVLAEAGPRDWHPYIHIPATCLLLQKDARFNWMFMSEPEPNLGGRRVKYSQGRVLGGSSSINGMLHVRGQPAEYDRWAENGCMGWSYADVLPYFRKSEDFEDGASDWRGAGGPLAVSRQIKVHPLTEAFVAAAEELGFSRRADMNGPEREGVAVFQQNRLGRFRAQPAQTYLRAAKGRPNLQVLTGHSCARILLKGRVATGAELIANGKTRQVNARREVILSAGTLKSPQILMLSGVGDGAALAAQGIETIHHSPQVGRNLQDHFLVRVAHRVTGVTTINERTRGASVMAEALNYAFRGKGLLTMGAGAAALFFRAAPEASIPDAQLSFAPGSFSAPGVLEDRPGMTIGAWPSYPQSKGKVSLRSGDPLDTPAIRPNYLDAETDRRNLIASLHMARRILNAEPLRRWSLGETLPGAEVKTDDEVLAFAREKGISGLHLVGTCAMGGPDSVTDPELRMRGIERLRVVDASVMPECPSGNSHAPTVMIAEKAADLILAAARVPA
jgi:choline dehydrogenase